MRRRHILQAIGAGLASLPVLSGCRYLPEDGLLNPCLTGLPGTPEVAGLLDEVWRGIDPARVWDCHVHLLGSSAASGAWIDPEMSSPLHPLKYLRQRFFTNGACADPDTDLERTYAARLVQLMRDLPAGMKLMLLAFDYAYTEDGVRSLSHSAFHTPDSYAASVAAAWPQYFEWIASIHPYRRDALDMLVNAAARGARAVKWLPPAQGMDPASPRCDAFYAQLARLGLPLLTHTGVEQAVPGAGHQEYANPLRLRRAVEAGVRVVMAHCGTYGEYRDTDHPGRARVPSFDLFTRLMDEYPDGDRLRGEISAVTLANRDIRGMRTLLERTDWHRRLLNGSDYPVPGVLPLITLGRFVEHGMLARERVPALLELRRYNPILFDFALKRSLQSAGQRFPAAVYETRGFFARGAGAPRGYNARNSPEPPQ